MSYVTTEQQFTFSSTWPSNAQKCDIARYALIRLQNFMVYVDKTDSFRDWGPIAFILKSRVLQKFRYFNSQWQADLCNHYTLFDKQYT